MSFDDLLPPPPPPPPPPTLIVPEVAERSDAGRALADPWMRIAARFCDSLIVAVIVISVSIPLMLADDSTGDGFTLAQSLAFVVLGVAWDVVCTMRFGGTPMKRAFGMRVIRSDSDGPLEWSHAIKRWALPGAFALLPIPVISNLAIFGVWIVGLVFLFAKPLRQTVSDQFAKTVVVKSR